MMSYMPKLRVAIIGAGPSGFGAAEVLRQDAFRKGYAITIYESNDYVGGKCRTVLADGTAAEGALGGYELGAGFIPKYARSYAALVKLTKRYGITLRSMQQPHRASYQYVKNGKAASVGQLPIRLLLTRPQRFFSVLASYIHVTVKYMRYGRAKRGFEGLPPGLKQFLPKDYNPVIFARYAHVIAGFGYADMDDPYLRPAQLYYYRYMEPAMKPPLSMVDGGTQAIWEAVAATYPAGTIRLNERVQKITRTPEKVLVRTAHGSEEYDYLIVGTSLKVAMNYLDVADDQKKFMSKMKYNHYLTVLCKVSGITAVETFNLSACTDNTQLGRVVLCSKQNPDSDIVTLNLYVDPKRKMSDKTIMNEVETSLWEDFGATLLDKGSAQVFHWDDYFGHLSEQDILDGWYENFDRDIQGSNRTLYLSSGLRMETMGASVEYATKQTKKYARAWLDSAS
jgi:hypothetical protein